MCVALRVLTQALVATRNSELVNFLKLMRLMRTICFPLLSAIVLLACNTGEGSAVGSETASIHNLSDSLLATLQWLNPPSTFELRDQTLSVEVAKGTDFFNSPEDSSVVATAALLYQEQRGDFVATALVEPDFSAQWNAVSLMVFADSLHWIKFAFERSDATGPSIVSVVTRETSDDANGAILAEQQRIWLAIARKGDLFSLHWSSDGEDYQMARLTKLPVTDTVKVGVEFQSPIGEQAKHRLHYFTVDQRSVDNLRQL
jgi:regulation of enolase protein 1 (concanavalin A-like superfamily)/predicted small secreted protein